MSDISIAAQNFATEHVVELAHELIEWLDSRTLADEGRLRELAAIWAPIGKAYALELAGKSAVRAALEYAVRGGHGD